eukprot:g15958.t1
MKGLKTRVVAKAAEAVLAERQAPPDGLQRLLPDFEALAASKASWAMDICSLAGRLLSALAAKLWNSGRKTDAAGWTQKAVIVSDTGSPAQQGNSEEEWFMIVHVSALRQSYYP